MAHLHFVLMFLLLFMPIFINNAIVAAPPSGYADITCGDPYVLSLHRTLTVYDGSATSAHSQALQAYHQASPITDVALVSFSPINVNVPLLTHNIFFILFWLVHHERSAFRPLRPRQLLLAARLVGRIRHSLPLRGKQRTFLFTIAGMVIPSSQYGSEINFSCPSIFVTLKKTKTYSFISSLHTWALHSPAWRRHLRWYARHRRLLARPWKRGCTVTPSLPRTSRFVLYIHFLMSQFLSPKVDTPFDGFSLHKHSNSPNHRPCGHPPLFPT